MADGSVPDIPEHEVLERIGSGGMATVYRARRLADDGIVALEVQRPVLYKRESLALRDAWLPPAPGLDLGRRRSEHPLAAVSGRVATNYEPLPGEIHQPKPPVYS